MGVIRSIDWTVRFDEPDPSLHRCDVTSTSEEHLLSDVRSFTCKGIRGDLVADRLGLLKQVARRNQTFSCSIQVPLPPHH
jgi:hypothetical protein